MSGFEEEWRSAVRFRRASRQLEELLRGVYDAYAEEVALRSALHALVSYLASAPGRTDANCSTTYYFIANTEELWRDVPGPLRAILDDMSGTLHDSIYAPDIARTFEATPEQLLERIQRLE